MRRAAFVFVLVASVAGWAGAQAPGPDPLAEALFPPDLVMRHASDIGLDERQRTTIKEAIQKAQARFIDVQFDLQGEAAAPAQRARRGWRPRPARRWCVVTTPTRTRRTIRRCGADGVRRANEENP